MKLIWTEEVLFYVGGVMLCRTVAGYQKRKRIFVYDG